jgi:lipoprotein-anchoring transpeptidase ErfK/SrfK
VKAPSTPVRILFVVAATLMLVLSGTLAWAAVSDYQVRGLVPKGVTVVGQNLGGMTESQARSAILHAVSAPMLRPVTVTGDNRSWILNPALVVHVNVDQMLNEAYSPRRTATFVTRLSHRIQDEPLPADIKPAYSIDATAVAAWIAQVAQEVDHKPKDAQRKIVKYTFKITPSVWGATVDQPASTQQVVAALSADTALANPSRVVTLPIAVAKPHVVESSFKTAIIVSLDRCKIYLFNGSKLVKKYSCAPGRAAYPTPTGDFKIDTKLANSSWYNPHAAWSAGMPDVIGPGPSNPMGVRKIGINYPGVFMHGVPPGEYDTIGTHASHGCMRMLPSQVLDLYGRVKVGDPVFIRD